MYGFIITTAGEGLLARASAGEGLTITEVWVGKGTVESAAAAKALTALLDPVAQATSTQPEVAGGQLSMLVEYRNDMGGVATLGPDGKVPGEQLPKMDYDPAGSAEAVQKNLTAHTGNKNNPHAVTAEQVGALASSGGVMSGAISMSGHKIANLAAPADSTDAANKQSVDEHAGARVILGSYVGTGKTGKSNPNQITLAEPFKILCIYGMQSNNYYKSIDGYGNGETSNIIHSSIIPTEYTKGISFGFGYRYSSRDSYGKKSTDGKTFSWYFDLTTPDATSEQLNASGTVYYYYAIV